MGIKHQNSYHHNAVSEPLLYTTIGDFFDQTVLKFPEREALVVRHQNIRWNYQQYKIEVDRLAKGFLKLGVEPGDRLGIWAPNCFEWCLTQFASAKIGAILVCINPAYRTWELEYALNKVQCKIIVSAASFKDSYYLDMLYELAPELSKCAPGMLQSTRLPHLKTVVRMGSEVTAGMFNFATVCDLGGNSESLQLDELQHQLRPDDPITIQFTSGTTGAPKGATLTHVNILNNAKIAGDGMLLTEQDRICIPMPLYHCFGMVMGSLACITHGAAAIYPNYVFDPLSTLQTVAAEKCTALHGVPTMFIAELECPKFKEFDLSSLRTGLMGGAPCPVEVMHKVMESMYMNEVLIGYGQTELSPLNHMTAADDPIEKRVSTVGKPGAHLEVKIIDENDRVVVVGERGEICTRGYSVMQGYWDDPELTKQTIDQARWMHSGDLGIMDAQGYVKVVGRIKDMILRGGENIYPREIEEFLYTHRAIQDVQVFGITDAKYGEQVCAWIKLRSGANCTSDQIKTYCKGKIANFKIPAYISFVDEYPMTITGKIQKFKMRQLMESELNISS